MSEQPPASPPAAPNEARPLQFETAEPVSAAAPSTMTCASCKQPLTSEYYETGGQTLCAACRQTVTAAFASSGGKERFILAAVYGSAAAVVGGLVWWGVRAATGWEIGLVAVAVGLLVGKAVRAGSQGRGGRRYQILAVVLTYCGVTLNYVPDVLKGLSQASDSRAKTESAQATTAAPARPSTTLETNATPAKAAGKSFGLLDVFMFVGVVLGIAFAAPFLAGAQNIIGILIIGFALWEAWKMNRAAQLVFTGPFRIGPPQGATVPPAAP